MAKNEITKKEGNTTPSPYKEKNVASRDSVNITDIHREVCEPSKITVEDIHSETFVKETVSSKKK